MQTSRDIGLVAVALAGLASGVAAQPAFDIIVSSPDFTVGPGGGPGGNNAVLRFSGADGSFLGEFAGVSSGLSDPRDVFLRGSFGDPNATVLVNSGNFPPSGSPDNDQILEYDLAGNFIGVFSDFSASGSGFVNPGGGVFGPGGNVFIGSRAQSTVLEFDGQTGAFLGQVFDPSLVAFPRGFVFDGSGDLFIGNGADPVSGAGGGEILRIDGVTGEATSFFSNIDLPAFSPLDVILSPDGGSLVVSSEFPFQGGLTPNAGSIVVIDIATGDFDVLTAIDPLTGASLLSGPRGLGFGPDGLLYASSPGTDSILRFDIEAGAFVDVFLTFEGLNAQALTFIPVPTPASAMAMLGVAGFASSRRRR